LIIANPVSGGGRGAELAVRLGAALEGIGLVAEQRLTTLEQNGRHLAARIDASAYRCIAVVGGDGSLHDVLGGLNDLATPVALLPAGTANVWAREAHIDRDPERVARLIHRGCTVRARLYEANGRTFFLFAGAGIDARIVERVEAVRHRRGHAGGMLQWIVPGWTEFIRRPAAELTVHCNGRALRGMAEVLVTRVRSYAAGMSMPPGIDVADTHLHVLAFARHHKSRYLAIAVRALFGRLRDGVDLTHLVTDGPVRIESRGREPFHLDGDHAGQLPVDIASTGRQALLVVPERAAV